MTNEKSKRLTLCIWTVIAVGYLNLGYSILAEDKFNAVVAFVCFVSAAFAEYTRRFP